MAFERIFEFFEGYEWHLDARPLRADNEINPDVLGYIFEKYINQKEMGAYYTLEDITEYIGSRTIIPCIFEMARSGHSTAFADSTVVWDLLREDVNRYIFESARKGVDIPLPENVAVGIKEPAERGEWNRAASDEFALPSETWREHIDRRHRCTALRERLRSAQTTT